MGRAMAKPTDDLQNWSTVTYTGDVKRLVIFGEVQNRAVLAGPAGGQPQFLYVRGMLGYRFNKHVSIGHGYTWIQSFQPQLWTEHQPFQQVLLEGKLKRLKLSNRLRGEERFIQGLDGVGIRLRDEVKLIYPLDKAGKWSLIASDEFFCNLNTMSAGSSSYSGARPRSGTEQNWLFLGVSRKFNPHVSATAGYMLRNNSVENSGIPVPRNHMIMLTLAFQK